MTKECKKCGGKRIGSVTGKTSDCCSFQLKDPKHGVVESDGYVPSNLGIGGGDYIEIEYCLTCGQILDVEFPIPEDAVAEFIQENGEDSEDEDDDN